MEKEPTTAFFISMTNQADQRPEMVLSEWKNTSKIREELFTK